MVWDESGQFGLVVVQNEGVRVFVVGSDTVPVNDEAGVRVGYPGDDVRHHWPRHTGTDDYASPFGGERLIVDMPGLEGSTGGPLDEGRTIMFETNASNEIRLFRVGDSRYASHINWCISPENSKKRD